MQVNFLEMPLLGNVQPHILPGLGSYQRTRNQLHVQCTSRLSPWMAIGCLSPRTVFWRAEQWHSCKADGHLDNWNSRNLSWTHMLDYLEAFRALNHQFQPAPLFSPWRFCSIFDISIAFCVFADMPYPPYPNTGLERVGCTRKFSCHFCTLDRAFHFSRNSEWTWPGARGWVFLQKSTLISKRWHSVFKLAPVYGYNT